MTLLELLQLLRKRLVLVVALPIVCALVMGAYSFLFMPNTYKASTSLYVLTKTGSEATSNMYSDLNASQLLTNDVAALIKSDRVLGDTAKDLGINSLDGYDIEVASETTTRVITLSVTGQDAAAAAVVANGLAANVSEVAQQVMDVESVNVIDEAAEPQAPSGPNRPMLMAVALLAGFFLAVAIVVVADMLNTRVRRVEEVEELLGLPVIGRMPTMKKGR